MDHSDIHTGTSLGLALSGPSSGSLLIRGKLIFDVPVTLGTLHTTNHFRSRYYDKLLRSNYHARSRVSIKFFMLNVKSVSN